MNGKVSHVVKEDSKVGTVIFWDNRYRTCSTIVSNEKEEEQLIVNTVGKRMFWVCEDLSGPISSLILCKPMRV